MKFEIELVEVKPRIEWRVECEKNELFYFV
jgi:hypothetical protein